MMDGLRPLLEGRDPSLALAVAALLDRADEGGGVPFGDLAVAYREDHLDLRRRALGEARSEGGVLSVDQVRRHLRDSVLPRLVTDGVLDPFDNCPTVSNGTQTDTDVDGVGNACDNCPTTPNPGQENQDGDAFGDACDACPTTYTGWITPPGDVDCDGFTSADETVITTLPLVACGVNAWPPDFDDSMLIDITDVLTLKPVFGAPVPPTSSRFNLVIDAVIDISDVLTLKPFFGAGCP